MLRRYSALFLVLGVMIGFTLISLLFGSRRPPDPIRDHAITRTNAWGLKALADLCRQHGLPVTAWNEPLSKLSTGQRWLAIIDPCVTPTVADRKALVKWVEAGGTLLLAVDLNQAHHVSIAPGGG